jgi:hypothetical protein
MQKRLLVLLCVVSICAGLAVRHARPLSAAPAVADTKVAFVAVVDKDGVPMNDIQAADLEVKAGGKTAEIVSVKPTTTPLRIHVIDADAGTGAYQTAILNFMNKLLDRAEFAITSVIVQPIKLTDFTSDAAQLQKALEQIGRHGQEIGGQLMEAISDATKTIKTEGKRGVILVTRVGGEGTSTIAGDTVREQLRNSGATLYAVTLMGKGGGMAIGPGNNDISAAGTQMQNRTNEVNQGAFALQQVLGDGTRESGGRYDQVVAVTMVRSLEVVAQELLQTYEVTYAVPAGVKPGDKLQVTTKRKNAAVHAQARMN